jgi:hypothetical protein
VQTALASMSSTPPASNCTLPACVAGRRRYWEAVRQGARLSPRAAALRKAILQRADD